MNATRRPATLIVNISPPKCGTTGLYGCLTRCRDVAAPSIKEARFFVDDESVRYPSLPAALRFTGNWKLGASWFWALFDPAALASCPNALDFTTYYALAEGVPANVRMLFRRVRAILVLRDPVDRFVSHYWQYRKMGISLPAISEVIGGRSDLSRFLYDFSDYERIWRRWSESFGPDSVLVMDFSSFERRHEVTAQIRQFLALPDFDYVPSRSEENRAGMPRFLAIQSAIFGELGTLVARRMPASWKPRLLQLRRKLVRFNTREQAYPALMSRDRALLAERLAASQAFYDRHRAPTAPDALAAPSMEDIA
jgi:hypothetical protein